MPAAPFRHLSLRTRASLLTLAVVLTSLWSLTAYVSITLRQDMEPLVGQQQLGTAKVIADDVERAIRRRMAALDHIAAQLSATHLRSPVAAQAFLEPRSPTEELFNGGVTLHNLQGMTLADSLPGAGRLGTRPDRLQVLDSALQNGRAGIGPPWIDAHQARVLALAVPVRDVGGIVIGAVVGFVQLDLPNFLDAVRHGNYGTTSTYLLGDRNHRIVITSSDPRRIGTPLSAPGQIAAVDGFVRGFEGTAVFVNSLGVEVQASVRQIPAAEWFIAVSMPTTTAFAPVQNAQQRLWWAAALVSLLAMLLTRWLVARQTLPALDALRELTGRIALVQQDAPTPPLEVHRDDEIGRLIDAFNALLQAEVQRKALLREVLNTSNVGIFATNDSGRITLANNRLGQLFGRPATELLGLQYLDLVDPAERDTVRSNLEAMQTHPGLELEVTRRFIRANGTPFWGQVSARQFRPTHDGLRGGVCVVTDVSNQVESREYELFRRHTLELLARNTPLAAALEGIVLGLESLRPDALCSVMLLDREGKHLLHSTAPHLSSNYNAAIDGVEIGPFVGSCGAAAYLKERVVARDLQVHPNWAPYRDLTAQADLRACWSQPILDGDGNVLGTFGIYYRTPREPTSGDLELIEQAAHLASLAITQHRTHQAVADTEERFRRVMETSPSVAVRAYTADGRIVFWNRACEQLYGYSAQQAVGANLFELLFVPEEQTARREQLAQSFTQGQPPAAGEIALRHHDGHTVTVFSSHALVQREDGSYECFSLDVDLSDRKVSEAALRDSEARYRAIIEWSPTPLAVHRGGVLVYVNPAAVHLMGAESAHQLLGQPILGFVHPDSRELVRQRAMEVARSGKDLPAVAEKYLRLDGQTIDVEAVATQIVFDGSPAVLVSLQDITRRNQAQQRLLLAGQVFDHAREGIMVTDGQGQIVAVNPAFTRITGYEREDVVGQNPRILQSGRQSKDYYAAMWRALLESGNWTGEVWNRRKSGEIYAELQTISTVRDAQGQAVNYVSLFSDVTAAKEHAQYIERIAHYDVLTNLPNRVLLADRLHQAMAQAQRRGQHTAVAFLDLDGFKGVNDRHGHDVGDQLLMALAQRMRQALREGDTLARIGGDEFVSVLVDLGDPHACVPLLERLLHAASEPVRIEGNELQVTASIGVAFFPQAEDVDADQLLRQADQAMYQAKLSGKNRYHVFDADQDRHVRGHHESLDRIRSALANAEFVLHYQPKVNMRNGDIRGMEALIRWQHPELGLIPPGAFLPVVEDHPLAVEIGHWVLHEAIAQLSRWQEQGRRFKVSVNIGARQLQQPTFLDELQAILAAHPSIDPTQLELEVLETSALEDLAHVSTVIEACAHLGIGFALDDFGTGYSSLAYLKRLPANLLKIDQSFVRDMLDDPDDLAILDGVIGLASAFRREVIAEGVETEQHGALLLQLGCDLGQGYGIARPMPASAVLQWASQWQPPAAWHQARRVHREDFALLYVMVEHRAWCHAVAAYVSGDGPALDAPTLRSCRFSRWLNREGSQRYGADPAFVLLDTLHEHLHAHAQQLHRWVDRGETQRAQDGLTELMSMQEKLGQHIQRLLKHPH